MLEGHPTPLIPWVDVATGSLGQGLPIGVGMGLAAKYLDRLPSHVWVLCGDSEMAEGSMWEAYEHASHYELDNLTAIIDVNRLGQRGETMIGWNTGVYVERARAFGWNAIEVDGHDVEEIDRAYEEAVGTSGRPTVIVARTIKGKGVKAVENKDGWHGKPLDDPDAAIEELGGVRNIRVEVAKPEPGEPHRFPDGPLELPRYELGQEVATRKAYGEALAALGSARGDVVALDGEVSNSTFAESACTRAAGMHSGPRLPRSSLARTTSSAWLRSAAWICASQGRTPASRSAKTALPRWRSRTSPRCVRFTRVWSCTRAMRIRPPSSSWRWRTRRASCSCARSAPTHR